MSGEKAMAAVETPQGEIERLRKVLDEVQTNQAEHAAHLDHLAHRADLERTKRATDRMRLNLVAQEVKELRDKIRNAEQEAKGRIEKLSEELWALFERLDDKIDAQVLSEQQGEELRELKKERDDLLRTFVFPSSATTPCITGILSAAGSEPARKALEVATVVQRSHPVKVGDWVERTGLPFRGSPIGQKAQVTEVRHRTCTYKMSCGRIWDCEFCTPCDPPPEASHITPEGKQTAEGALPQPGDVVRLVREPSADTVGENSLDWPWESRWGCVGDRGEVVVSVGTMPGARSVRIMNTGVYAWWPLSCIEVVKGGKS